jgi:hypothetical protein
MSGDQLGEMKLIRAPWIRCRADEAGGYFLEMQWRKHSFVVLAYSAQEARDWWGGLSDAERDELLGLEEGTDTDQSTLF